MLLPVTVTRSIIHVYAQQIPMINLARGVSHRQKVNISPLGRWSTNRQLGQEVILLRKLLAAPLPGQKTRSGGFKQLGKHFQKNVTI